MLIGWKRDCLFFRCFCSCFLPVLLLCAQSKASLKTQFEAIHLPARHSIVVNIVADPQAPTQYTVTTWLSCLELTTQREPRILKPGQVTSFIIAYGRRCTEPVLSFDEAVNTPSG